MGQECHGLSIGFFPEHRRAYIYAHPIHTDTPDWVEFDMNSISKVVTRTFNRVLVGRELCKLSPYFR